MTVKFNVLVLDDDGIYLKILKTVLADVENTDFTYIDSPLKALEELGKREFHLIITDIEMPEMDGFEFIVNAKKQYRFSDIPFIFLTGAFTDGIFIEKGYKLGAFDYIIKSNRFTRLIEKINIVKNIFEKRLTLEEESRYIRFYKDAIDASTMVSIFDEQGRITYANELFISLCGYSLEELKGEGMELLRPANPNLEVYKNMRDSLAKGCVWKGILKHMSKSGEEFYVFVTLSPLAANGISKGYVYFGDDISLLAKKVDIDSMVLEEDCP